MKRNLCFFPILLAFILLLSLSGCWNPFKPGEDPTEPPTPPQDQLLERTTPQNVLHNLKVIYADMDNNVNSPEDGHALAEKYRELFHPDFKFFFVDGQQPPEFMDQNWWGRDGTGTVTGEVPAFDTLMTKRVLGIVNEIKLSWTPGPAETDNRTDPDGAPLHPGWMHIHVNSVLLEVPAGSTLYIVQNGQADFYFAPDPNDPAKLWTISEWWDKQP